MTPVLKPNPPLLDKTPLGLVKRAKCLRQHGDAYGSQEILYLASQKAITRKSLYAILEEAAYASYHSMCDVLIARCITDFPPKSCYEHLILAEALYSQGSQQDGLFHLCSAIRAGNTTANWSEGRKSAFFKSDQDRRQPAINAKSTQDFLYRAEAHARLGDPKRQLDCLSKAQDHAVTIKDWIGCTYGWHNNWPHHAQKAYTCANTATTMAQDHQEFWQCAQAWLSIEEPIRAMSCQVRAEMVASPKDMIYVARHWLELGDQTNTLRCLQTFEDYADQVEHWCNLTSLWADMGNRPETMNCLQKAETLANDPNTISMVAELWCSIAEYDCANTLMTKGKT